MRGRANRISRRGARAAAVLAVAALTGSCASDLASVPGGFRHARNGYRVSSPAQGGGWTRVEVDGADLAFRHARGSLMSLRSRCNRPVAAPAVMARQLQIGLHVTRIHQSGPVAVAGVGGWVQHFDTRADADGAPVQVKTVTLVADSCHYDFALTGKADFDSAVADFDRFWQSFVHTQAGESS